MLATSLSMPLSPGGVWFFLNTQNCLLINTYLNCTNHKGKYLWLKYYKKIVLYIYIVYKTFHVVFIHFYWKDMSIAIFASGRANVPTKPKKPISARPFDQKVGPSLIYFFYVHTTSRPNNIVLLHLFFLLSTTIRPRLRVLTDLFLLFALDHSTKIYGPLSFIFL